MLDKSAFEYLKPTDEQMVMMNAMREASKDYTSVLERLPEGPDKTYILRKFREVAMWANVALTRKADGSPLI